MNPASSNGIILSIYFISHKMQEMPFFKFCSTFTLIPPHGYSIFASKANNVSDIFPFSFFLEKKNENRNWGTYNISRSMAFPLVPFRKGQFTNDKEIFKRDLKRFIETIKDRDLIWLFIMNRTGKKRQVNSHQPQGKCNSGSAKTRVRWFS